MSYLLIRRGPEQGSIHPIKGERVTLGRGHTNDIVIDDYEVKREHLEFKQVVGGYELRNVSSSNSTFVNGQPISGVWLLRSQCIIEIGDTITLEYHLGEPTESQINATSELSIQFYLVVMTDSQPEPAVYPLQGQLIQVGRSTSNDIVIVEAELSRKHFELLQTAQGYAVRDSGSTNGTVVNGEPVGEDPRQLYSRDLITIGTTVNIHVTDEPERFTSGSIEDFEIEAGSNKADGIKRTTSQAEVASVAEVMKRQPSPTEAGTGLDNITLEDQILISYGRADWEHVVGPMINYLYDNSVEAWVDQYLAEGSSDWLIATEQSRLECWGLVVVVSAEAMQSDLVKKNWRHFHNREKPIILFIVDAVDQMPIGARKLTRVQFNPGVPEVAFQQLVAEIKRLKPS